MGWSAGTYTKGNAGTGGWAGDQSLGIGIEAGRHDTQDNDFATGINQCLNKDGSNAATGNLNLGGFLPTNLGSGTAAAVAIAAGNDVNTGIFSPAADNWAVATNGVERLRVDNNGKLGVGTTTPSSEITISKGVGASATISLQSNGNTSANEFAMIQATDGATSYLFNRANGNLVFGTNNLERIRIAADGKVGIGGIATWPLDVIGNTNGDFVSRFYNSNNGASGNVQIILGNDTNNAAVGLRLNSSTNTGLGGVNAFNIYQGLAAPICLFTSGTVRQTIASNGIHTMHAYGAGTATFSAAGVISSVSDERLKVKDGSITDPLTKIEALQPGYWRWKDEMQDELGSQRELGFFAQNVNAAIGEEAAPVPEEGKRWGYYDRSVLAVAVEAIKELHAKVKTLEAKVAALES